jgi:hypothetical protein
MRRLARLTRWIALGLIGAALYEQLRRPAPERTWTGQIGPVPYDFRPPTIERIRERIWNPETSKLLTPMPWGIGWTLNLAAVRQRLQPLFDAATRRLSRSASAR